MCNYLEIWKKKKKNIYAGIFSGLLLSTQIVYMKLYITITFQLIHECLLPLTHSGVTHEFQLLAFQTSANGVCTEEAASLAGGGRPYVFKEVASR